MIYGEPCLHVYILIKRMYIFGYEKVWIFISIVVKQNRGNFKWILTVSKMLVIFHSSK